MVDPEEVSSPLLTRLDEYITNNRLLHEFLGDLRRHEFTRQYDRLRKQRIRQGAPVRHDEPNRAA